MWSTGQCSRRAGSGAGRQCGGRERFWRSRTTRKRKEGGYRGSGKSASRWVETDARQRWGSDPRTFASVIGGERRTRTRVGGDGGEGARDGEDVIKRIRDEIVRAILAVCWRSGSDEPNLFCQPKAPCVHKPLPFIIYLEKIHPPRFSFNRADPHCFRIPFYVVDFFKGSAIPETCLLRKATVGAPPPQRQPSLPVAHPRAAQSVHLERYAFIHQSPLAGTLDVPSGDMPRSCSLVSSLHL